jgi:protoporphyrinogen IX oxidase
MALLLLKTIHIIGFISWFAGLFYLGRIFVYHKEAIEKPTPHAEELKKQYSLMEWRVYNVILTPAMVLTWICGTAMLYIHGREWFVQNMWMHHKLLFLLVLTGYHGYSKVMIKKIQAGTANLSSFVFRFYNEVPTVMMFLIVPLAVFKNYTNPLILMGSVIGLIALLIIFTFVYKNYRLKNEHK